MHELVSRRLTIWVAILCLAITVIALGAAAKYSQFESTSHSTSYLTQSVKMVSSDQTDASALPPLAAPPNQAVLEPLSVLRLTPVNTSVPALPRDSSVRSPLLV